MKSHHTTDHKETFSLHGKNNRKERRNIDAINFSGTDVNVKTVIPESDNIPTAAVMRIVEDLAMKLTDDIQQQCGGIAPRHGFKGKDYRMKGR